MAYRRALGLVLVLSACGGGPGAGAEGSGGAEAGGSEGTATGGAGGGSGGKGGTGGATSMAADAASPEGTGGAPDAGLEDVAPSPADMAPAASSVCPPGPFEAPKAGPASSICPGFSVKYNWNEGPTWVASQKAFFFSNFPVQKASPGDMIKFDPATNKCEFFIEGNGCNGLTPDRDGSLLATCQTPRALMRYDLVTKKGTVVIDMVEGKKLDSPNDVVVHRNGTIFFSNTTFELGGRPQGLGSALMRLDPMGMVHVMGKGFINPLGLSPDQKRLYAMGGYWELDDEGVPQKKTGGFTLGNDGIGVDCAGNVYTNSGAIVSPQNQTIGHVPRGTNMGFGGEDRKTLLIVGGRSAQIVQMNLPGLP